MKKNEQYAEKLAKWKEAMKILPDERLLNMLRVYLGEIKTPYNKEKLLDSLLVFMRDDENLSAICEMLSVSDIKILAAIHFFNGPSREVLHSFFSGAIPFFELNSRIQNLTDRMLIFSIRGKVGLEHFIAPAVESRVVPFLSPSYLVNVRDDFEVAPVMPKFSAHFFAAFVSFAISTDELCKISGGLKKKAADSAAKIFSTAFSNPLNDVQISLFLEKVIFACKNLGLCAQNDSALKFDFSILNEFALLSFDEQRAFLAAASTGAFTRNAYFSAAKTILFLRKKYLGKSISTRDFHNAYFLARSGANKDFIKKMHEFWLADVQEGAPIDFSISESQILQAMIDFDMAQNVCENGEEFISFPEEQGVACDDGAKNIDVEANYDVNIFAGFSAAKMLKFVRFLLPKSCDFVSRYEINKASCVRAFSFGMSPDEIISLLAENSSHEIPSSLVYSINDWHKNFSSCKFYKGYVLQLASDKRSIFENSAAFQTLNPTVLADGIYLIDFSDDFDDKKLIAMFHEAGLEYLVNVKNDKIPFSARKFSQISFETDLQSDETTILVSDENSRNFIVKMLEELESLDLTKPQKSALKVRILQKLILNKEQLKTSFLRLSDFAASDYSAKLRLLHDATVDGSPVEIMLSGENKTIVGKPFSILRKSNTITCKLRVISDNTEREFTAAQIIFIRAIPATVCENLDLLN